ncbi:hypothetical protein WDU94_008005 [Cyamophila willieti]
MDFVSTGGGLLVDNIFLLFNAYDRWINNSKKEEKNLAKKEREEKIQEVPAIIEPEPVPYVPFEPPRSEPIDIPAPKYRQHWKTTIDYEETPPRRRKRETNNLTSGNKPCRHYTVRNMIGSKPCPHSILLLSFQPILPATNLASSDLWSPPLSPHQDLLLEGKSCSRLILPYQDVPSRAILFSTHPTASRCAYKSHLVLDSSNRIKMCL